MASEWTELLAQPGTDRLSLFNALYKSASIVDLSVLLEKGIPKYYSHPSLIIDPTATHEHDGYANQALLMSEHTGTHVDAPYHMHADMADATIERLQPDAIVGRCTVIDLSRRAWQPGERASLADLQAALDESGGHIEEGDVVLIHFGWMQYWTTSKDWGYYADNQPGFTEDVADYLIANKVKAVGTDTAAVGTPVIQRTAVGPCYFHEKVLRQHIYLIECLHQLHTLPAQCFFVAAPLKIAKGSGSPIRAMAIVF